MKFDHAVKYKGVFYPTGADVPVEAESLNSDKGEVATAKTTTSSKKTK